MLFFAKQFNALRPTDEESEAALKKIAQGEIVSLEMKRPRNLKWHRKYWALCGVIAENTGYSKKAVSDTILIESGYVEVVKIGSEVRYSPQSISFAKMTQDVWEKFWDSAVEVVCSKVIPGLDSEDIKREVMELVS